MRKKGDIELLHTAIVDNGQVLLSWLGQAGFVLKTPEGTVVCIDPYLSNSIPKFEGPDTSRLWFPSFPLESFQPDLVICTHNHLDHTDPETLPLIASFSDAEFWGPDESIQHILAMHIAKDRTQELVIGNQYYFRDVKIKPVFALHTPGSVGLLITVGEIRIYLTADTQYDPRLLDVQEDQPNLLLTCINAKYGNLNAEEACSLAKALSVDLAIPMHYGLIPSNTVPPDEFVTRCKREDVPCATLKPEKNYLLQRKEDGHGLQITEWQ